MLDLNRLNDAQREAVTYGEGPLLVLAGPGSGKTFTITQRIFYLLEHRHVPPEQILVLTFTKDAAISMKTRFQNESNHFYPVCFGTFHSVFYHILRESSQFISTKIMNDAQKKTFIADILKKNSVDQGNRIDDEEEMDGLSELFLEAISVYKNILQEEEAKRLLPEKWRACFYDICTSYQDLKKRNGLIDFDDMVYECYLYLKSDREALVKWGNKYRYLLLDEFQDINPIQYEMLKLLSTEYKNICAVGDDDQSIYGFRGAKPACLKSFEKEYQAKIIHLNVNYRSADEIIQAAQQMIAGNQDRYEKLHTTGTKKSGKVAVKTFESIIQEQQYLTEILTDHIRNSSKTIGLLFRTNLQLQRFAVALYHAGISFHLKDTTNNLYDHFVVRDIMAYLQLASKDRRKKLLFQILNKPERNISRERLSGPAWNELEHQLKRLEHLSPYPAVQYIRKVIGYEEYLRKKAGEDGDRWKEWEELLNWMTEEAKKYRNLEEWKREQGVYERWLSEFLHKDSSISLMTVHASKGLEFDIVWIPDCNEGTFPHGRRLEKEQVEEERRIFYVGMTRARERLELLGVTGTRERPKELSRFLDKFNDR